MRNIGLSAFHYAVDWPVDSVRTPAELTELGCQMAGLPEGADKEDKLLEILQCFHGYLFKYMSMILRGHLSLQRHGKSREINKDTHLLLQCFIPKEKSLNKASLAAACRTLHLAFKGMTSDEVFDQLMLCMVKSIRKYDPFFHEKIKRVVDALEGEVLRDKKLFTTQSVNRAVGHECAGYLRYLAKRLFLIPVPPAVPGEPQYKRTVN